MKTHLESIRQLYQPDISVMRKNLPDMCESLHNATIDLSRDCSLDRVDLMLAKVKGAETSLVHLRRALIVEKGGTG